MSRSMDIESGRRDIENNKLILSEAEKERVEAWKALESKKFPMRRDEFGALREYIRRMGGGYPELPKDFPVSHSSYCENSEFISALQNFSLSKEEALKLFEDTVKEIIDSQPKVAEITLLYEEANRKYFEADNMLKTSKVELERIREERKRYWYQTPDGFKLARAEELLDGIRRASNNSGYHAAFDDEEIHIHRQKAKEYLAIIEDLSPKMEAFVKGEK